MRKKLVLFICLLSLIKITYSQVFWTENFGTGCSQNNLANGSNPSGQGIWIVSNTGVNDPDGNVWYVSAEENGNAVGACGSGCGNNRTLHIANVSTSPIAPFVCPTGDCGAAYDAGLGASNVTADIRAETPIISCAGQTGITLGFKYMLGGDPGNDYAEIWYFDGAVWAFLSAPPQTPTCPSGQGKWTAYTVSLPASANNNSNVKIGFRWINNDDGAGTDPSIAVDDVTLSAPTVTTTPLTFSLSLPSPVCQANTINATFTSTSTPTSFTWSATSTNVVFTPANSGTTTISFTAPGTYTVSLTACQGTVCGTATSSIQVLPTPTINVTASSTVFCIPSSSTLTATGGASATSYTWAASSGPAITNTNIAVISPTINTTYTVLTSIPGCTTGISITVPVSTPPSLTLTPNSSICNGQSINLTASGAATYTWNPSATLSSANGAAVTATPVTTTNYTVTGSNGVCTNTAVVTVTVGASASVSITPTNTTICLGQNASLVASGGSTYTWTASSGTNPPNTANVSVTPTITTTYTVLTGSGTCTAQAVSTVSVAPAFTMTATPSSTTICSGGSIVLTVGGATSYTWSPSTGLSATSGSTVNATPTISTTYTVIGDNAVCSNTAAISVTVNPAASVSVTPTNTSICSGQTTTVVATGSGSYTWTASNGTNPPNTTSVSVSPTVTTTYTVLTGTGTCTDQAIATVSVSPAFTPSVTPGSTTICTGGTGVVITASGASNYTWSPATGLSSTTGVTVTANPTVNTTYTVLADNGVCTNTAITSISVTNVSTSVTASSSNYCIGSTSITLTGTGATTYSWSPATGLSSTSGTTVSATPSVTTTYTVTGTTGACSSNATVTINVAATPVLTVTSTRTLVCAGATNATLTATGANTYTWAPGFTPTPTLAVNPSTTTSYTVVGQTLSGCLSTPAVITMSVLPSINPIITAGSPSVCLTKTVAISTPSAAGLTYTWQPVSAISGASNTSSIVALPPSTATVIYTVTISNGVCIGTDTIQIQVQTAADITDFTTLNNDTICTGGCVTFSATATGSMPIYYQWYYQSGVGTSSVGVAPEACYPSAGSFSVVATASNTCGFDTLIKTNFVTVFDLPTLIVHGDTTINIGEIATVYASGGITYNWSPNVNGNTIACITCSSTVVQPTLTTQYIVVASNSPYCKVQDTVTVQVDENCGDFFIPNVFSPNGDGLNDVVNVRGRCIFTFNLQIFNRWGEKVFETSSLESSWDGTFRGQKMDTGVFVYKADGVSITGDSFKLKGNITLLR